MFDNFHFIRPDWLYALVPALLLFVWIIKAKQTSVAWSQICDKELLDHFLVSKQQKTTRSPLSLLAIIWIIAIFALAGPSWNKVKSPIYTNQDALVILFDLSSSMNAQDLKPSRLEQAKRKLTDLLNQREEGQTALVVYAGDSHIVSPLTPDQKTILSFVPVLSSNLMPIPGSNLESALTTAQELFTNSGINKGNILLFTDGLNESISIKNSSLAERIKQLKQKHFYLSIIGVGTQDGAPIPHLLQDQFGQSKQSGFIKNADGNIVVSRLEPNKLKTLAQVGGGSYQSMSLSDNDFKFVLAQNKSRFQQDLVQEKKKKSGLNENEQWQDQGAWFTLALLPFALFSFRQGWLLSIFIVFLLPIPYQPAYSASLDEIKWQDLWLRADQQGSKTFDSGNHKQAAQEFKDPQWKGSAYYKSGQYKQAIEQFEQSSKPEDLYNKANSHAKLKQFDDAIKSYDEVLKVQPKHHDALKNKKIIEELLEKQKNQQQKKNDQNSKDKSNKKEEGNDKGDQKQDGQQSDQSEQSNQDKQQGEENNSDQQEQSNQDQAKQEEEKKKEQQALEKQKEEQKKNQQEQEQQLSPKEQKTGQEEEQSNNGNEKENDSLFSQLSDEEKQSMQQYLNQIKDDPAYLLRRKFYLNATRAKQRQQKQQQSNLSQPSPNGFQTQRAQQPW